jgi:hypothetical protein
MKPETADCLAKPRECLDGAEEIAGLPLPKLQRGRLTLPLFTPPKDTFASKPVEP